MKLELRNLSLAFGDTEVLRDISLQTGDAGVLAVVGPSGGGKSTLLRVLAGLLPPDRGSLSWDGRPVPEREAELLAYRRSVGTVFQAYNLFPHLTALENLSLPLREVHGFGKERAEETARRCLARFRLAAHADKKPGALSGGQCQRVAIARALSFGPTLLFFDEPTSALDPERTYEVLEAIREVREEGRNLLLVTHEIGFARRIADELLFLADGRVLEQGPPDRVIASPRTEEAAAFFEKVLRW